HSPVALSSLSKAFKTHKPAFGVWLTSPGFFHARTVAQASSKVSWILIDCDQGLASGIPVLSESIAAIHSANGPSALVRIQAAGGSSNTRREIMHALDAGARGVLVPMISTAAQAQDLVAYVRFLPLGRGGPNSSLMHRSRGTALHYLADANDTVVVMTQIETTEGLANVKEIAEVDGLDVIFIGPCDLSMALGYPARSPDPHLEVEKTTKYSTSGTKGRKEMVRFFVPVEKSSLVSKYSGIYCIAGFQAAQRAAQGFDMVSSTSRRNDIRLT
ncbi:Pyruvate/Phosphoenolpyruvate kinase-like domain-containing protein, partial [Mycena epipterygia]